MLKVPDEFHSIFKYMKIIAEVILIPILSEGIGYGILVGVGLMMAIMVTMLARTESKWLGTKRLLDGIIRQEEMSREAFSLPRLSHRGHGPLPFSNLQVSI